MLGLKIINISISNSGYFKFHLNTLEKINRNLLSLNYKMRSLHEKVDKIDEIVRYNTVNNHNVKLNKDSSGFESDLSLNNVLSLEDENASSQQCEYVMNTVIRNTHFIFYSK